ncbi:hypothetical protein WAI453_007583 [Rhynchosporium graminicola]
MSDFGTKALRRRHGRGRNFHHSVRKLQIPVLRGRYTDYGIYGNTITFHPESGSTSPHHFWTAKATPSAPPFPPVSGGRSPALQRTIRKEWQRPTPGQVNYCRPPLQGPHGIARVTAPEDSCLSS